MRKPKQADCISSKCRAVFLLAIGLLIDHAHKAANRSVGTRCSVGEHEVFTTESIAFCARQTCVYGIFNGYFCALRLRRKKSARQRLPGPCRHEQPASRLRPSARRPPGTVAGALQGKKFDKALRDAAAHHQQPEPHSGNVEMSNHCSGRQRLPGSRQNGSQPDIRPGFLDKSKIVQSMAETSAR